MTDKERYRDRERDRENGRERERGRERDAIGMEVVGLGIVDRDGEGG